MLVNIGVYAYGESRLSLTFDPCFANIRSMCPINASVPIEGSGIIPLAPAEIASIPDIALSIPDFEGQAILRVFSNSTQSVIACYSAVMTNGNSFSHPTAVGITVGLFVAVAFLASVATAIYGQGLPEIRKHYAHSLSIWVVFAILQHVFFTGALSMNFPSVLVAFWSNFGWASGIIYSSSMQRSINHFIGSDRGNITKFGAAPSGQDATSLGGGFSPSEIYKRAVEAFDGNGSPLGIVQRRDIVNSTSGFTWYGSPVATGLPLPGNYSSFAGTLAQLEIPASNAFLTGFIWFLITLALMMAFIVVLKTTIELLTRINVLKTDKLNFFRKHWIYCGAVMLLRTCYIAFFALTFLALFQFAIGGATGALAIASLVFILVLVGMTGLVGYALWYRLSGQTFRRDHDRVLVKARLIGKVPWIEWTRGSTAVEKADSRKTITSFPWRHLHFTDPTDRPHVHDDEDYLIRFGWLSARFRRSKWWVFSAWLIYEFIRACFYGGAAGHPLTQVFGLMIWEIIALFTIGAMRPFESNRLNMLMIYCLGFSKVVSVALCSAFDPRFGLGRILTTVIGVIIIVIQGVLVALMMVAAVVGAISSYMSIRRYHEEFHPQSLVNKRIQYFAHVEQKATDRPPPKVVPSAAQSQSTLLEVPKTPYFAVAAVRRETKIEDEDLANQGTFSVDDVRMSTDMISHNQDQHVSEAPSVRSRHSMSSVPYGAKRLRTSWSTRDFQNANFDSEQQPSGMQSRMSLESSWDSNAVRAPGLVRQSWTSNPSLADVAHAAVDGSALYRPRHQKSVSLSYTQR